MSDTVTYTLKKPITVKGQTYTSLTFREATAGDMVAGEKFEGNLGKTLAILACMAGVEYAVMKEIRASDILPLTEATASLLGESSTAAGSI
jgi:hypothetical protein